MENVAGAEFDIIEFYLFNFLDKYIKRDSLFALNNNY